MAQGTIHIKTTNRRGDVLWEGVWCAACVAEHQRIFGKDKGVTIQTWPWTGAARPCDSCDDAENAPEFKLGAVVALVLCLLLPGLASAQSAPVAPQVAVVLGNVADLVSTEIVIAQGRGREGNPIMGQSRGQRIAVKTAATAAQVWVVRELGKRGHPRAAKVIGYTFGSFLGGVTVWNLSR